MFPLPIGRGARGGGIVRKKQSKYWSFLLISATIMRFMRALILCLAVATSLLLSTQLHAAGCPNADEQPCPTAGNPNRCISERDLCILEPIPGGIDVIPASAAVGLGAFFYYINNGVWQWVFGIGVAMAVLNGTAGGFMIVLSNGDSGKVDAGKSRFFWSAVGLVVLLLSGVILEFLNPLGFQNS